MTDPTTVAADFDGRGGFEAISDGVTALAGEVHHPVGQLVHIARPGLGYWDISGWE